MNDWINSAFDAAIEFRISLNAETDRGCALMAAAYLDDQLAELLKSFFVDDPNIAKRLLEQAQPLGTFSARIDATYALGLISQEEHKGLHLIRKIRNEFGHVAKPLSFTDQAIAERCKHLEHLSFESRNTYKAMFTGAVMAVLAGIDARRRVTAHRTSPKDVAPATALGTDVHMIDLFMKALIGYMGATVEERENAGSKLREVVSAIMRIDVGNEKDVEMLDKLMGRLSGAAKN